MARRKHKPQRTCIACREVKEKRDLVRIVRTPDSQVIVDATGKANGRGLYLCRQQSCWGKGLKKERLAHALKTNVTQSDIERLRKAFETEL